MIYLIDGYGFPELNDQGAQVSSEVFANDVLSPRSQKNLHTFCVKVFGTDQVRSLTDWLSG